MSRWASGLILLFVSVACSPGLDPPPDNGNGSFGLTFQLAPSRQAVAIIDPPGFVELLSLSETEPTRFLRPLVKNYVTAFAEHFVSDADFIIFMLDAHRDELRFAAVGGFNISVHVPEAGLGPFVDAPAFPAMPELRSYIYLARKDSLVLGPSLHEIAHGWGVRLRQPQALGDQADENENHWGFAGAGGQLGGWIPGTLMDLGAGQYELSAGHVASGGRSFNTLAYSLLELYLMGLVEPELVDPLEVAINPVFKSLFEFSADGIVNVTIDEIIAQNGARVPTAAESQNSFKISLVVLTDHELSDIEWEFYKDSIDYFSFDAPASINDAFPESKYAGQAIRRLIAEPDPEDASREFMNFYEATRGLATVKFVQFTRGSE